MVWIRDPLGQSRGQPASLRLRSASLSGTVGEDIDTACGLYLNDAIAGGLIPGTVQRREPLAAIAAPPPRRGRPRSDGVGRGRMQPRILVRRPSPRLADGELTHLEPRPGRCGPRAPPVAGVRRRVRRPRLDGAGDRSRRRPPGRGVRRGHRGGVRRLGGADVARGGVPARRGGQHRGGAGPARPGTWAGGAPDRRARAPGRRRRAQDRPDRLRGADGPHRQAGIAQLTNLLVPRGWRWSPSRSPRCCI